MIIIMLQPGLCSDDTLAGIYVQSHWFASALQLYSRPKIQVR